MRITYDVYGDTPDEIERRAFEVSADFFRGRRFDYEIGTARASQRITDLGIGVWIAEVAAWEITTPPPVPPNRGKTIGRKP